MRIIVKCFAGCKDAVGAASIILEIPSGSTVGEAFIKLIENYASKNRLNIDVFEERQIKQLLSRMFKSEYEYLLNERCFC